MAEVSRATRSATACANVLILCLEWLRANAADATVRAETEPGSFEDIVLVPAIERALAAFRAEHVTDEPDGEQS